VGSNCEVAHSVKKNGRGRGSVSKEKSRTRVVRIKFEVKRRSEKVDAPSSSSP